MSGTNPVKVWSLPQSTLSYITEQDGGQILLEDGSGAILTEDPPQTPTAYMGGIDGNFSVAQRFSNRFAPHQSSPPAMTVALSPGAIWNGTTLTEVGSQTSSSITAPVVASRIDRIVTDSSGAIGIITGAENPMPVPPAFSGTVVPIAQVLLQVSTIAITNDMLTDERNFGYFGGNPGVQDRKVYTTSGTFTWTKPANLGSGATIFIQVWSGGGSGGAQSSGGGGGGAGSYRFMTYPASVISSSVTVTVGAGGASVTGSSLGSLGGNSSFGSFVTTFGGGWGAGGGFGSQGGAAGGWFTQSGFTNDIPTNEGQPGDSTVPKLSTSGYYIGGGGGDATAHGSGASSVWGGGGGGGSNGTLSGSGGFSFLGGAGGAGGTGAAGMPGLQPSGGGGGGDPSGKGGDGQVIVTVFNG